jgi:hypothetical protein
MLSLTRVRVEQQSLDGDAQQRWRADRPQKRPVLHRRRATFLCLLPDLQGLKNKALAAVKLAALLGLLLTLAALLEPLGKRWLRDLIALDGFLLLLTFFVSLAVRASASQGKSDVFWVAEGQVIPADGEIVCGVAVIDEAAITGVSGGVVREANSDRSIVLAGTLVVSGRILVRTTTASR